MYINSEIEDNYSNFPSKKQFLPRYSAGQYMDNEKWRQKKSRFKTTIRVLHDNSIEPNANIKNHFLLDPILYILLKRFIYISQILFSIVHVCVCVCMYARVQILVTYIFSLFIANRETLYSTCIYTIYIHTNIYALVYIEPIKKSFALFFVYQIFDVVVLFIKARFTCVYIQNIFFRLC